jgi:photosystem II stability/assembly factor-like uncharacterized protein
MRPLILIIICLSALNAQAPRKSSPADNPKFMAIWEPVNFDKDIDLHSVAFTSAEEGWAGGEKGTILHTKNGGKNWEAQLGGDPAAKGPDMTELFFLDATHGWAHSNFELFATTDGSTWHEVAKTKSGARSFQFTSPETGFSAATHPSGGTIQRSDDGGKIWKPVTQCVYELKVQGLARRTACNFVSLSFPTASDGYAIGGFSNATLPPLFAASHDGGKNWELTTLPDIQGEGQWVHFLNAQTGLATLKDGKVIMTTDGGKTWAGVVSPVGGMGGRFAMLPSFTVGVSNANAQIGYSSNLGRGFTAKPFKLPAAPHGISFPDARHGYVIGSHGMVYRYIIVPTTYKSEGMLPGLIAPGE